MVAVVMRASSTASRFVVGTAVCLSGAGCGVPNPPADILKGLAEMEREQHVVIARVYEGNAYTVAARPGQPVRVVQLPPGSRSTEVPAPGADGRQPDRPIPAPDGSAQVRPDGDRVWLDARGATLSIVDTARLVGGVHWSPDSKYVLFVEKAGRFDPVGLPSLDDMVYLTVVRAADGSKAYLHAFSQGYPTWMFRWMSLE